MSRTNPEQTGVFERINANRASERALLASRPHNPWLERERFTLEANAEVMPKTAPMPSGHRGRGRPRKSA